MSRKKKSGNASEDGGEEEKVGPTVEALVAEKSEQYGDARADTKQTDQGVDDDKRRHAQDHDCVPPRGKEHELWTDTIHETKGGGKRMDARLRGAARRALPFILGCASARALHGRQKT
jgi:hypothetical protein